MTAVDGAGADVAVFARHLAGLVAALDPERGWYAVWARRDPASMRACLAGEDVPPWDVVEGLLADYATGFGAGAPAGERERVRRMYAAAVAAHDRRPGGREELLTRWRATVRHRSWLLGRGEDLLDALRDVSASSPEGRRLAHDLAWARDDHARASARVDELGERIAALGTPEPEVPVPVPAREPEPVPDPPEPAPTVPAPAAGGARFGRRGLGGGSAAVPEAVVAAPARAPRGARFGGAPAPAAPAPQDTARDAAEVATAVAAVRALRAEGRSGEAHVVLCEAAYRPARQLPLLAVELERAGLGADWAGLLWEVAALPPELLVAAVVTLTAAGHGEDCGRLLRQGVARPPGETAAVALGLARAGLDGEAQVLLGAFVRTHAPADAAPVVLPDPRRLVPRLLEAARTVSAARERDIARALRTAGVAGV